MARHGRGFPSRPRWFWRPLASDQTVTGTAGIPSAEAFGTGGTVTGPITGTAGITSAEAFGTGGVVAGPITGTAGIASAEAFGTGTVTAIIIPGPGPVAGKQLQFTVKLERPGMSPLDLTPIMDPPKWSSAAIGGYASCRLTVAGDRRHQIPYLSLLRVTLGTRTVWEGLVEDRAVAIGGGGISTSITAFGKQRLLARETLRRVWSMRDLSGFKQPPGAKGTIGAATLRKVDAHWDATAGRFTTVAGTEKTGVYLRGKDDAAATAAGDWIGVELVTPGPDDLTLVRLMATFDVVTMNANHRGIVQSAAGASGAFTTHTTPSADATIDQALVAGATRVRLGIAANAAGNAAGDEVFFESVRLLGTSVTEDTAGGFYGGTILRDLIPLVPGLSLGVVEDGTDFTIQAVEAQVRRTALSVVQEVAGYYAREWGVWDDGLFEWRTRALDQHQWTLRLDELDELALDGSVDGTARQVYVLYTEPSDPPPQTAGGHSPRRGGVDRHGEVEEAASKTKAPAVPPPQAREVSSSSVDQRNPFVKTGMESDEVFNVGQMTTAQAQQLATSLASDRGAFPQVSGRITLQADRLVRNALGTIQPAALIRAGENITVADLPKTELLLPGRDGETLFHVVDAETDLGRNTVTLSIESSIRRADVILARLAALTR